MGNIVSKIDNIYDVEANFLCKRTERRNEGRIQKKNSRIRIEGRKENKRGDIR